MYKHTPKTRKRLISKICALVGVFFILASFLLVPISATAYPIDKGIEVFNYDEMILVDNEPSGFEIQFPNDFLFAYNERGVEIHIFAKYRDEEYTSAKWVIETSDRDVAMIPKNVVEGGVMPLSSGEWGIYKFTLDGLLPISADGFTIQNYYDQNLQEEAISPDDVAFVVFVSTYRADLQFLDVTEQRVLNVLNTSTTKQNANELFLFYEQGYQFGYTEGYRDGTDDGYVDGYDDGKEDGLVEGEQIGYDDGYDDGKDVGYGEGYRDGSDGIGLERLPFAITDSIANMFTRILNFELLGVNVLALCGTLITLAIVAFVIKRLI